MLENVLTISSEIFTKLYNVDVSNHLVKREIKGKMYDYLKWSSAIYFLKIHLPTIEVTHLPCEETGAEYWIDPLTKAPYFKSYLYCTETLKTTVPIIFPFMDYANNCVSCYQEVVNPAVKELLDLGFFKDEIIKNVSLTTTIVPSISTKKGSVRPAVEYMAIYKNMLRSYVKCIAFYTGLGLRLWTQEDVSGEDRKIYLQALDQLLTEYTKITKVRHPLESNLEQMNNDDLKAFGKQLKEELKELISNSDKTTILSEFAE